MSELRSDQFFEVTFFRSDHFRRGSFSLDFEVNIYRDFDLYHFCRK